MTGPGEYLVAVDKADAATLETMAKAARKRSRAADPPGDDPRPEIIVRKGRIHETADQAEAALVANGAPFYARGEVLVRLAYGVETPGIERDRGLPSLVPATSPMLIEAFETAARFTALVKDKGAETFTPRVVGCPEKLPAVYLARIGRWALPSVRAVSGVPILHGDGSLVSSGYDPRSRSVVCTDVSWPALQPNPTRLHAEAALLLVNALIAGFPFVEGSDRSAAIAAMLSAVLRPSLPTCPGFGFTAPVRGSGKSKLADVCAVLATGRPAAAVAWPPKEEEAEKRLGATLLAGDAVVLLDNLETPLRSVVLNSAMTQSEVAIRILGQSFMPRVEVAALFLATGNNLVIQGDLSRRFLLCHLDPGVERPELRAFGFCPVRRAKTNRVELVRALLTIAQWGRAQSPQAVPLGSFEEWSRRVRDPLLALGLDDPCASLDALHREDPEREAAMELVTEWHRAFRDRPVAVAEAIREAQNDWALRDALDAVAGGPGGIVAKRLGRYLLRYRDRVLGERVLRQRRDLSAKVSLWLVE